MKLPSDFFSINGDPFTEEEISALKRTVDSSLPEDYLEFLSFHGGGVISETYSHVQLRTNDSTALEVEATMIFGNATPIDIWENAIQLDPTWLHDWGFYFCEASNPPEDKFLINLSNEEFSIGSILYEDEGKVFQVSKDFTSFISLLINSRGKAPKAPQRRSEKFGKFFFPSKTVKNIEFSNANLEH